MTIKIDAKFDTRQEADDFAKEIEGSYPAEKFATDLKVGIDLATGEDRTTVFFTVTGSREEKPK